MHLPALRVSSPTEERTKERSGDVDLDHPWRTVVWNDPVNLMSYVTYVFRSYFGYPEDTARRLMLQVHHEGRAVVSHGQRERMEVDVAAMHSYGLWATLEQED